MPIDYRPIWNGQFKDWNEEKKFGFIYASASEIEVDAHASGRIGTFQTNRISGKRCLFALGLDPDTYSKGKKDRSALVWIIEDDAGDFDQYLQLREAYLADQHNLQDFIKAEWYVNLWTKKAKCYPRRKLACDDQLSRAIKKNEESIDSAIKLEKRLVKKVESPYFAINEDDKNAVRRTSWNTAAKRGVEFFRGLGLAEFLKLCKDGSNH